MLSGSLRLFCVLKAAPRTELAWFKHYLPKRAPILTASLLGGGLASQAVEAFHKNPKIKYQLILGCPQNLEANSFNIKR